MKRALISVSDKSGLLEFVKGLVNCDYEIISTGGTKKFLDDAGIKTIAIDEVTGFPEILDGRVKTLHPMVHGGLLAKRDDEKHIKACKDLNIQYIDLVCVNLYPFKETIARKDCTFDLAIENIDIGGPSMLRSAAKNHKFVTVVTSKEDYEPVLEEIKNTGDTTIATRKKLAAKVFRTTAAYDAMIAQYLTEEEFSEQLTLTYQKKQELRYGENPHQKACFYVDNLNYPYSIASAKQLHGKELSYNNIQDANATLLMLKEFPDTCCCVAVKHMNPSGIGIADTLYNAWRKAYEGDSISIFGGIVAFNREVTLDIASEMHEMFLELVLAPSFTAEAFEILAKKKNIRLMTFTTDSDEVFHSQQVSVCGGILVQDVNNAVIKEADLKTVTKVEPTKEQIKDLLFGDKVVKHVKSNAIVVVKDGQTLGIGAGQMNRVGAAKIALEQAGEKAKGAVLASDAYFPMPDTVELANQYGISAIIQPGGSIRDQDSIDVCDEKGMAMVYTATRHFKH